MFDHVEMIDRSCLVKRMHSGGECVENRPASRQKEKKKRFGLAKECLKERNEFRKGEEKGGAMVVSLAQYLNPIMKRY